jgi:nucleoside-diphosphate-sugar epimerase
MTGSVILTGAAGFVGRRLAQRLLGLGYEVYAVDLTDPGIIGTEFVKADISGNIDESLLAVPKNATFIHLAAVSTDSACKSDPISALNTNLLGTTRMIMIANAKGASKFIFASSEWVYPETEISLDNLESQNLFANQLPSLYAMTKLTGEGLVKNLSRTPSVSLRFGIVYGPRAEPGSAPESLLLKVRNGESIEVGNGSTARRFIYVDDLCEGIISAVQSYSRPGNVIYNLAGSELVALSKVIFEAGKACGRDTTFTEIGSPASIRNPISDKFYQQFDFKPKVSLQEGLQACLKKLL